MNPRNTENGPMRADRAGEVRRARCDRQRLTAPLHAADQDRLYPLSPRQLAISMPVMPPLSLSCRIRVGRLARDDTRRLPW